MVDDTTMSEDMLRFWYECMRKHSYKTQYDADMANKKYGNTLAYQCSHCGNWHNGRPRSKNHVSMHQMRHDWNRRRNKPEINTIVEVMKNPKTSTLRYWKTIESELKQNA